MSGPLIEHLPLSEAAQAASRRVGKLREECLRRLLIRHRHADPWAGERLVYRLSPILAGFLQRFNLAVCDREDLLQECWIRIHHACPTYRETEPVLPWIYGVVRHTQMDAYRKRRRRQFHEVMMASIPERATVTAAVESELLRLLDQLPQSQREILLLMKVDGLSVREVASALSSSEGSVKQKAHRAYAKLRSLLPAR